MIVVADASPLIALARIGRLEMLRDVFGSICLPDAVWREVVEAGVNRTGADLVLHAGWIDRRSVTDDTLVSVLRRDLGAGEAEAIVLAREIGAPLVLMDERMGRAAAMRLGLRVTGLVGVLIEARERKLLADAEAVVEALHQRAGAILAVGGTPADGHWSLISVISGNKEQADYLRSGLSEPAALEARKKSLLHQAFTGELSPRTPTAAP